MVVPRSATQIDADDEFTLYAVTTFKKTSQDFIHKCREHKWTPRDFKYKEGGREEEQKEVEKVAKDEKKVWGEALRLGRTAWGEAVMAWIHVLALRVFVETVLRYGLPLSFVCGLVRVRRELISTCKFSSSQSSCGSDSSTLQWIPKYYMLTDFTQTTPKLMKRVRNSLDNSYSYLAGNAFGRDKKGRMTKDDSAMSADMQAAGHTGDGGDYSAYVCYEFEIN